MGQEGGAGACGLGQSPHPGCGPHTLVAVTLPLFRHRLGLIGSISPSCSLSLTVPAFAPVGSCSSARGSGAGIWCGLGTCGGPRLISIGFLCLVPRSKQACVCSLGVGSVPYNSLVWPTDFQTSYWDSSFQCWSPELGFLICGMSPQIPREDL